ncbi:MAG: nucleotidyltransferase family protein [Candidatus Moranbacteria bacterium]|nr:nucleotidyltransferase family protein [Candidatus Moranbacteria bacterium]
MSIEQIKQATVPILNRYGVVRAGVFGSYARNEADRNSDVDILVDIQRDIGLFEFVRLKLELEKALGHKVDLVEYDTIKPLIRQRILKEEKTIL